MLCACISKVSKRFSESELYELRQAQLASKKDFDDTSPRLVDFATIYKPRYYSSCLQWTIFILKIRHRSSFWKSHWTIDHVSHALQLPEGMARGNEAALQLFVRQARLWSILCHCGCTWLRELETGTWTSFHLINVMTKNISFCLFQLNCVSSLRQVASSYHEPSCVVLDLL